MTRQEFNYLTNFRDNFKETFITISIASYHIVFDEKNNNLKSISKYENLYQDKIIQPGHEYVQHEAYLMKNTFDHFDDYLMGAYTDPKELIFYKYNQKDE